MKYLLDTHMLLWYLTDDDKLTPEMIALTEKEDATFYYSILSLWEVGIKHSLHPDSIVLSPRLFASWLDMTDIVMLPVLPKHILQLDTLHWRETTPELKDPFDRLLLAQAKAEKMVLLTHDTRISGFRESCILKL